jgi:hypothetical protein
MLDLKRREFIALLGGGALLLATKVKRAQACGRDRDRCCVCRSGRAADTAAM